MSFWQILGRFAFSDQGETIQKVSDTTSVSSDGTTYTRLGSTTVGSDGSVLHRPAVLAATEVRVWGVLRLALVQFSTTLRMTLGSDQVGPAIDLMISKRISGSAG